MSLDVIPKIHQKTVLGRILDQGQPPNLTKASFFYEFYVVRALEHAGMQDRYMEVLQRWRDMLAKGLSTTPESPDPTRSDTHAWSAHPAFDLPTIIGGIHPAEPGFASVRIEPALSDLQWVRASMPHPGGGIIQVSYERTHNGTHAWITLPGSLKGVLLWKGKGPEVGAAGIPIARVTCPDLATSVQSAPLRRATTPIALECASDDS